ncbi:MAG TPA: pyridoxal-dependent decarboxylase, partial [Steroidobacteraceae bacterium]|nr:pyridoxal-dependent decarboxylase [Steroidobacteraceae bacterium]
MDIEEFRRLGHEVVDWIADYRARSARGEFPVMSRVTPGAVRSALPAAPPVQPQALDGLLDELTRLILPGCTHWQDPRFFAYFPSNSSLAAVLGDFLSTGLAQLGLNWQASPALTELEELSTDWLRQMLGLSRAWSGVIQDTASTSTLVALICARERTTDHGAARGGLQGSERPLTVYTSSQSHSSVEKAALLAGFGRDNLRVIAVDDRYGMSADALRRTVEADRAAGFAPCAVVATVGSTATTAVDPLEAIATVARAHGLWLHVDAAMAGSAMILPECRPLWQG